MSTAHFVKNNEESDLEKAIDRLDFKDFDKVFSKIHIMFHLFFTHIYS